METRTPKLPGRLRSLTLVAMMMLVAQFAFAEGVSSTRTELPSDLFSVDIDQDLVDAINAALPESRAVGSSFLNPDYSPNLVIGMDAQVSITAIDEGAGYRNSFGYFSYDLGTFDDLSKADVDLNGNGYVSLDELSDIDGVDAGWVFPNFSMSGKGGQLDTGDSTWLGGGTVFEAGTGVSFFLAQNAWNGRTGTNTNAQTFYSIDFLNPEAASTDTVLSNSADSSSRHTAALFSDATGGEVIFGFEDLNRTNRYANAGNISSDEDFNDAIFVARSNPIGAFNDTDIPVAPVENPGLLGGAALALLAPVAWRRRKS